MVLVSVSQWRLWTAYCRLQTAHFLIYYYILLFALSSVNHKQGYSGQSQWKTAPQLAWISLWFAWISLRLAWIMLRVACLQLSLTFFLWQNRLIFCLYLVMVVWSTMNDKSAETKAWNRKSRIWSPETANQNLEPGIHEIETNNRKNSLQQCSRNR